MIADSLRKQLEEVIGDAFAGTIDDAKVLTYRPSEKWAVTRIREDYPDLAQHFIRTKESEFFDIETFRRMYPEIAEKYRVRQFRQVEQ